MTLCTLKVYLPSIYLQKLARTHKAIIYAIVVLNNKCLYTQIFLQVKRQSAKSMTAPNSLTDLTK